MTGRNPPLPTNWTAEENRDPDETEGRRLSRKLADSEAFAEMWLGGHRRKVKLKEPQP